jgi:rubrerythrin
VTSKNYTEYTCQVCSVDATLPLTEDIKFRPNGWYFNEDEETHVCPACVQKIKHFAQLKDG